MSRPTYRCVVRGCNNTNTNCDITLFTFSKNADRARMWAIACNREDLAQKCEKLHSSGSRVCAKHFEAHVFTSGLRNRLKAGSVPTIFTTEKFEEIYLRDSQHPQESTNNFCPVPSTSCQTQTHQNRSLSIPRKRKADEKLKTSEQEVAGMHSRVMVLEKELEAAKSLQNANINDLVVLVKKFCPENLANFIIIQIRRSLKNNQQRRRYNAEFKNICLQIYFKGPTMYETLLRKALCFPSVNILTRSITTSLNMSPGVHNYVFNIFKQKVDNMKDIDKLCILCVDQMKLKANLFYATNWDRIVGFEDIGERRSFAPALTATVIMARGLNNDWRQPLAYFFLNTTFTSYELKKALLDVISELTKIGVSVVGITSDLTYNNLKIASLLNISPDMPYFFHEQQKIVYLFDVPHLLTSIRNSLVNHNCYLRKNLVSWDFVKQLYEHDRNYSIRALPEITDTHISATSFNRTQVKFASEIFSASLHAAMQLYIRFEVLPREAQTTAKFILQMSNLFDLLNSSSVNNVGTCYQEAYKGSKEQNTFLLEYLDFFNNIEFINNNGENVTNKIKCVRGWKITCSGILHLWDVLKSHGFEYLYTKRTHLDCTETFFNAIRQRCVNPTPIQFRREFKHLFCMDLLHSGVENLKHDETSVWSRVIDFPYEDNEILETVVKLEMSSIETDYRADASLQENFPKYIFQYVMQKCLQQHSCVACENYAKNADGLDDQLDDKSIISYLKAFEHTDLENIEDLYSPSENFITFVTKLEVIFQNNFSTLCLSDDVVKTINYLFEEVCFDHPCNDFPLNYLLKLYARVRIYYTLSNINRNLRVPKYRKIIVWHNL